MITILIAIDDDVNIDVAIVDDVDIDDQADTNEPKYTRYHI